MTTPIHPHADLVLAGRYRLVRELGRGGMGSVWLAHHTSLHSRVAVKILMPGLSLDDAARRFLAEARAAAGINSPHVVQLFDHGVERGLAFLAMELLEGETLAGRLRREGRLGPRLTAQVFAQLGRGVSAAHEAGIVHRDLKPDNVFLVQDGGDVHVKVLDFGIAKALNALASDRPQTATGTTMGTVHYMSPEQIEDSKRAGFQSDVWSLAVMAFECLVGRRPFQAGNVVGVIRHVCQKPPPVPSSFGEVPPGFDEWFAAATARDLSHRPVSVAEAMSSLVQLCSPPSEGAAQLQPVKGPAPRTAATRVGKHSAAGDPEPSAPKRATATAAPVSSDHPASARPARRPRQWMAIAVAASPLAMLGVYEVWSPPPDATEPSASRVEMAPADPGRSLGRPASLGVAQATPPASIVLPVRDEEPSPVPPPALSPRSPSEPEPAPTKEKQWATVSGPPSGAKQPPGRLRPEARPSKRSANERSETRARTTKRRKSRTPPEPIPALAPATDTSTPSPAKKTAPLFL